MNSLGGKPNVGRYIQQPNKIMSKKVGQHFLPMPLGMRAHSDTVYGCFLDKEEYTVHWYQLDLQYTNAVNSYQVIDGTTAKYTVEYPVLCYLDAMPDKR